MHWIGGCLDIPPCGGIMDAAQDLPMVVAEYGYGAGTDGFPSVSNVCGL
jgi:hypothetical protein